MKQVLIIGGGAAGLMAAVSAAQHGAKVTVLEKMKDIGRKLLITGKGRCNITNSCDLPELVKNMPGNGAFLYSAFNAFSNQDMVDFLEQAGLPTKVERGGRVFPVSDQARDVIKTFSHELSKLNVEVKTGQTVKKLILENGRLTGAATADSEYRADAVIVTTGGASYPGTGSSGDGYRLALAAGHTIIPIKPSLVPVEVEEEWITELQGLSLKNVTATVFGGGKKAAEEFGEMLFTHYGLSGPIILSLSKKVSELFAAVPSQEVSIEINLKPALSTETLDKRLQRDFIKFARKQLKNSLNELLPAKIIPVIIDLSFIDPEKFVHQITKEERVRLLNVLQHLTFTISQTRPVAEAIVTAGGVSTKELNSRTMESKLVTGLFFAGEVIDIDGYTGGFNLQAAFSSGYVAGMYAASQD
ncbi:NAD(P)/FAD-dependent oxidoreductase [Sporomusa sp.]|uniref:NAD(P)/FAD-dependent oxidoreductase n=1 Tax=Sporomusa sp. TaxID=2078658 RepID=UPI002CBE78DC|nr:NAD(P)/FAD-dependent oxidoreductase [Sporomusa sp.]HWR45262.1 NAD(P)/FAD-dependent oxidoreductase [Sporomusa sp.]